MRTATHLKHNLTSTLFSDSFSPKTPKVIHPLRSLSVSLIPHPTCLIITKFCSYPDKHPAFERMTSPMVLDRPVTNSSDRSISRRRKKKTIQNLRDQTQKATTSQWKSDAREQVYSSKLLQALRQVRINNSNSTASSSPKRSRAVREAADRVLATTAKGRTRWSRAILTNRLKLKFMKKSNISKRQRVIAGNSRWQKKARVSVLRLKTKNLPAVQRKARVLGRLVPGCGKEALPVILEEATDYIPALEMQVRAMSALFNLLSGSSSTPNHSGSSRPPPPT